MIPIQIDATPLQKLKAYAQGTPIVANKAAYRAINKTLKWLDTQGRRAVAKEFGLPVRAMTRAKRIKRVNATSRRLSGILWLGIAPVKAAYFGKPRQLKKGAKAGKKTFPGAFVATMRSGHIGIFRRKGKSRLPIREVRVPLQGAQGIVSSIARQADKRLLTIFQQELSYELGKL